ncbi:membrane protein [Asanoa ishikariensis]|uniref:Acyltransferase family protein n=1 Tax=Asanoa ishikariensis TaxID=137265 RepID=A0A1H3UPQ7_9ACTN|nr:acyltransferase [Asanoa ishikariensis]GIF69006.1 membrane protein [Asanoa ishikariensis]SDZ63699.1 Acyltransferase family protein [Asanoa ishikariensis]
MTATVSLTPVAPAVFHRERAIDGLRALAILGVVCGHWLVGGLSPGTAGGLVVDSPLRAAAWLAPMTWLLQMLGVFFLVGGYAAGASLTRWRAGGGTDRAWLRRRFLRLAWPVLAAVALVTAALPLAALAGAAPTTLRTWAVLLVQPFWFIGIYAVVTALTPVAMWLDRRWGWAAALPLAGMVAVADVARYGLHLVPDWAGYLTVVPAWMFTYQLGVAWARGGITRTTAWRLLLGGAALFATLVVVLRYPASMVTVPGAGRSNSNPPSLLVPALAAVQSGAAILLRERFDRLLHRHNALWTVVAVLNLCAMTIFCWHQTALVAVSAGAARLGSFDGLTDAPSSGAWVAERLSWFPVLALALGLLVVLVRRFERPAAVVTARHRAFAVAAVAAFTAYLVLVY